MQNAPENTSPKKVNAENSNFVYVSEQFELSDSALEAFSDVFARFQLPPDENTVRIYPFIHRIQCYKNLSIG